MRENGPLLSRVLDPPGTKGGPRAGNFPGPPKNSFCPALWLHPGQKAPFCPGSWLLPGQKVPTPISPFLLLPSPTLGGFLDLRHATVVPCSHRASYSPPPP